MSDVAVSVVIPARNVADTLGAQLEALARSNTDQPFEVIVADNGSSDETSAIASSFAGKLDIRVVDASRRPGANVARNEGIRAARAPKILLCDADDEVDRDWVEQLSRRLDDVAVAGGTIDYQRLNSPQAIATRSATADSTGVRMGYLPAAHGANLALRREVFEAVGCFDEQFQGGDDTDFCWRAQLAGFSFGPAPSAIVNYRLRTGAGALWTQWVGYGAGEAHLYAAHRASGVRRRSPAAVLRTIWWLASRGPLALKHKNRRGAWVRVLATQMGRVKGSLKWRVVYV